MMELWMKRAADSCTRTLWTWKYYFSLRSLFSSVLCLSWSSNAQWLKLTHCRHSQKGTKFHKITRFEGATLMSRFDSSEVESSRTAARILTICKLVDIGKVTRSNVLQYLGRLKWNHRRTVLETAELFWQTGHRSTWPVWFVCPVFLKPYHMEGGGSWLGWCNHTDKAGLWCVIVAVMLILCIWSNWTPEWIFPMCVCVCLDVYVGACGYVILAGSWE